MRLSRIDHKLAFDAVAFQSAIQHLALANRIRPIVLSVQDQGGRADCGQMLYAESLGLTDGMKGIAKADQPCDPRFIGDEAQAPPCTESR